MVKGLYYRLVVLFLVMIGSSLLFASIVMLPAFFLSSMENNIADSKLEAQKREPVPLPAEQTLKTIKDLNNKIALIESAENNKFIVTQKVINTIILKKMSSIKITDISYEASLPPNKKISIQGTAPSREALLLFRKALGDDATFKSVDLPISNFIKGSNIQFYLSLIPA